MDVTFGIRIGSDWPEMGHIWDFLRLVSVNQNVMKLILKSPRFVLFRANLTKFATNPDTPTALICQDGGFLTDWLALRAVLSPSSLRIKPCH